MNLIKKAALIFAIFFLDFVIVFLTTYLFALHIALQFISKSLPNQAYFGILKIFFTLTVLLIFYAVYALAKRFKPQICPYIEGIFFGLTTLIGCWILFVVYGSIVNMDYPKVWVLCSILLGFALAWFLPKRLKWRKVPLFLCFLLGFNLFFVSAAKIYGSQADFLPNFSPGIKVVCELQDPFKPDESERMKPAWKIINWWIRDFCGLPVITRQYTFLALSNKEDFLYVQDFNFRGFKGYMKKISLEDFSVVASYEEKSTFIKPIEDLESDLLILSSYIKPGILFFKASDLELIERVDVDFPSPQLLRKLKDGNLLISSELGVLALMNPQRQIIKKVQFPWMIEYFHIDSSEKYLVVEHMAGVAVLDLEEMKILRQRYIPFASIVGTIDPEWKRIFRNRIFYGDVVVLDYNTLKTITRIPLSPGLRFSCYLPGRNVVVVGNHFNGYLYFIDANSYKLIKTLWVGTRIRDMAYSAARDKIYVGTALRVLEVDVKTQLAARE